MNTYVCDVCRNRFPSGSARECPVCGSRILRIAVESSFDSTSMPAGVPVAARPTVSAATTGSHSARRESMTPFRILFWLTLGFTTLSIAAAMVDIAFNKPPVFGLFLAICGIGVAATTWILFLVQLYRGWSAVQCLRQVDARLPSPRRAVGFLFIPCFNFYWMFVCTAGLIRRINQLLRDGLKDRQVFGDGIAISYCVLFILNQILAGGFLFIGRFGFIEWILDHIHFGWIISLIILSISLYILMYISMYTLVIRLTRAMNAVRT